jgi:serine/threonine protein kinase
MICPFCEMNNDAGEACLGCGHPLAGTAIVRRGSVVTGRYEILGILGRGGMGMVYRAFDRVLEDPVALKVLRPEIAAEPDLVRRFRQEIRLARRVRHRNVCAIHEYAEDGALRCLAMELVLGVDVKQEIRQHGAFAVQEAYRLAIQSVDGLEAIHDAGVVHRDLKTSNIMRDERGVIRLMDFGIAKEWHASATVTSQILGTPEYVSPEQARGEAVDFRSDLYAMGIVIFELFTGDVPFRGDTPVATIVKHLNEPPPFDAPIGAPIPRAMLPLLRKLLAKKAADRHQTATELAAALRQAAGESLGSLSMSTTPLPAPPKAGMGLEANEPTPSLVGDLRTMTLPIVLEWIAAGKKTGTLSLERAPIRKRLIFRHGAIRSSWSNDPRESLGQFLVRDGWITEEQLFKALLKQEESGQLLGTVLVSDNVLDEETLKRSMRAKAEETIHELFLWTEGRFEFHEGSVALDAPITLELAVPEVVAEGHRRAGEWERIRKTIPSLQVTFKLEHPPEEVTDAHEARILVLAARGKTLAEISLETRLSEFETALRIDALCRQGVLRVDQVGDEPPTAETLRSIQDLLAIADERLSEVRLEEALETYEAVLSLDRLNQRAKKGLVAVVEARHRARARKAIAPNKVPHMLVPLETLTLAKVDPQEAFILSRINNQWDVQSILKLCPMSEDDAMLAFARLLGRRIIDLR